MTEHDDVRMQRLGVSNAEMEALQALWGTPTLLPLFSQSAIEMQRQGSSPLDVLDAAWHKLHHGTSSAYLRRGFTPHQAFLLISSERAYANLYGDDGETDKYEELLDTPMRNDILTELLLVAKSQAEAEQLIANIMRPPEQPHEEGGESDPITTESYVTVSTRAARANARGDLCDCTHRPGG